jgi:hypothetical protein
MQSKRKTRRGGRPPVIRPCPRGCGAELTGRQMLSHKCGGAGRKNNDGPYAPDNCEWQTPIQQGRNRRDNHFVSAFGKTLPISEWAELTGLSHGRILKRLLRGWSQEQAVSK